VTSYRCDGCGVVNRAVNDLSGMAHTRTGGKPSECSGRYQPAERVARHTRPSVAVSRGGPGDTSPGVLADQLALSIPSRRRRHHRQSRPEAAGRVVAGATLDGQLGLTLSGG
jgi:hypothetical protein